jgi:hypothetical protein
MSTQVTVVYCEEPPMVLGVFDVEADAVACLEAHLKFDEPAPATATSAAAAEPEPEDEMDEDDDEEELPFEGFGEAGRYVIVTLSKNRDYFPPPNEQPVVAAAVPRP